MGFHAIFLGGRYTIPHLGDSLKDISVKLPHSMLLCLVLDFHAGYLTFIPPPLPVDNFFELPPCLIFVRDVDRDVDMWVTGGRHPFLARCVFVADRSS